MNPIPRSRLRIALALALAIPTATPLPAQSVTMGVGSDEGPSGGDVELPVFFREAENVGVFEFELVYDGSVATLRDVRLGDDLTNAMIEHALAPEPGRAWVGVITPEVLEGDLGEVLRARFDVLGDEGASTSVEIANALAWEDGTDLEMLVTTEAGVLSVTGAAPLPWRYLLAALAALLILGLFVVWRRRRGRERPVPVGAAPSAAAAPGEGSPATGARFCSGCGAPVPAGTAFCAACGRAVAG